MTALSLVAQARLRLQSRADLAPQAGANPTALRCFYQDILPGEGRYCLFLANTKSHVWAESTDEFVEMTEERMDEQGVYFGTAAFKSIANRKQTNVLSLKALRLDIDAGAKKHERDPGGTYPTQSDALVALGEFTQATGLVPSYVVSSGEGLHVYYGLDVALPPDAWTPLATALEALAAAQRLRVDTSVTADTARILRPIGTLHGNGQRVSVIERSGRVYTASELRAKLPATPLAPTRTFDNVGINDELSLEFDGPPASAFEVARHCGALREVAVAKGDVPEPHWRAMLGLVKHTVEGIDAAHEWSRGYDGYDPGETERKFDNWTTGPTTCAEFARHSTACASCEFSGKVKSPIMLGQMTAAGEVKPTRALLQQNLPDWRVTADGQKVKPHNTVTNVKTLATLSGWRIRYNVMTKRTEITAPGIRVQRDDYDNAALAHFGDVAIRAGMSRDGLAELVDAAGGDDPYHPAQEWTMATPWDRQSRLQAFHETLELLDPNAAPLRDKLMDAWALQAIGALEEPDGIAAQGVLVLAGPQDVNKTRWVSALCPIPGAIRTGLHINPLDKDSVLQSTGSWISEAGELDSTTRRSDVSALKAFFTRREDVVRPAYARRDNVYRRRTAFVGTVNGSGFLVDDTGNRRYWTIAVRYCHLLPPEVMQQVWAEYRARYIAGERWHLDAGTKAELNASNVDHTAIDPLRERILTQLNWTTVAWETIDPDNWRAFPQVQWMTATDICCLIGIDHPTRNEATRVGAIVSELNRVSGQGISRRSNGAKLLAVPTARGTRG